MLLKNRTKVSRYSGVELLRVLAMMAIMLGHSHSQFKSLPDHEFITNHPLAAYINLFFTSITVSSVNIFIAISGWYGIKFKVEGLCRFIFQVFSISILPYCIILLLKHQTLTVDGIRQSLTFYEGYWFVIGYLGLYILSPMLNAFIQYSSKANYNLLLLCLFLFQSYYSWISSWYDYFGGYSIVLFIFIYLLSAYIRKYSPHFFFCHLNSIWIFAVLLQAAVAMLSLYYFNNAGRQLRYDNPVVIMTSVILIVYASKISWKNKIVNWLAASCFTVYLLHYNPFVYPYFKSLFYRIYTTYDGVMYSCVLLTVLFGVYVICTLIDQVRLMMWNYSLRIFQNKD